VIEAERKLVPVGRRGREGGEDISLLGGKLGGGRARVLASRELHAGEEREEPATGEEILDGWSRCCCIGVLPAMYSSSVIQSGLFDGVNGFA